MRVLIAVTHLLGAGHLTRAAAIARGLAAQGHEAILVSGGVPQPLVSSEDVRFVQVPPVRIAGTAFGALLDAAGRPANPAHLAHRQALLLQALAETRPDAVITELFPFGRRALAGEFLALVEAARRQAPRPAILASVRDVLVAPAKPERIAEAHARCAALYDGVLVHGDERLIPLDLSWPLDAATRAALHYTGYVEDGRAAAPRRAASRNGEILVSGGSSGAGLALYRAALGAARIRPDRPWRILVGAGIAEEVFAALSGEAPANAEVERARPDFPSLLADCALSVSQAGYNTAVDVLAAGAPALFVPFEAGRETEQRLRAERLAAAGFGLVLPEAELSAAALAGRVEDALALPAAAQPRPRLDGARETVAIVEKLVGARRRARAAGPSPLEAALRRVAEQGETIELWWRDDDAVAATPALDRLLALSRRHGVPLALAAIPAAAETSLVRGLADAKASLLVHGWSHQNHASAGEKPAEFGAHRPLAVRVAEAAGALARLRALAPAALPVFVPPWNRLAPDLVPALAALGYRGLSAFAGRPVRCPAPGLVRVDAHIDPIDWRGTRSLADPNTLLARLAREIERRLAMPPGEREPIGILTHHLVHDDAVWAFCDDLWGALGASESVRYPDVTAMFSIGAPAQPIDP